MPPPHRLPPTVRPRRYDLLVRPDLTASAFSGTVTIDLQLAEATGEIVLHARDLAVEVVGVDAGGIAIDATCEIRAAEERVAVRLATPAPAGPARLELRFSGAISHGLLGFYRSAYTDTAGAEQVLAATQFEAPHARAAFPCFDEPEFKAVFAVTLEVDDGLCVLSNGPEIAREPTGDGRVRVRFGDTIAMSTYLVAWVVGPLELTAPVDAGGVAVRVAHVPGKGHLTRFPLDVGAFAIRFFADYYGIPYPGEKCDLVALPDFSFGAMENLGCVTFRESRLLLDPDDVTLDEMLAAALTIVHEVAHMWFGDLVTMKWWNGIWLNEAFATFMEHVGVDAYNASWRTWDDFATGRAAALDVDALTHTRTVEYEVHTPDDADGMFDLLTYQKGGSVLRMLERWLGAEEFQAGVRLYLGRYQLANTETTDLWDAIEEASGHPVRQIMDSWIFQPGYPVLRPDGATITQRRFTYAGDGGDERYSVPLLVRVHDGDAVESRTLLHDGEPQALEAPTGALVVLNAGGEGFYRVAYPPAWRSRLLDAGVLGPVERFTVVDDLWALMLAGEATAAEFLETARHFRDEDELVVWRTLAVHLRSLARFVTGDALGHYRAEAHSIVAPLLGRLGWDVRAGDDDRTRQLRGIAITTLGLLAGDADVLARARAIVADEAAHHDADVLAAAVHVVAAHGGTDDFDRYAALATGPAANPQAQLRFLYALGDFPDESLVLRACALACSDAVRAQNAPFVLQRALRNRDHGAAAWRFVQDRWDAIGERLGGALTARATDGVTWLVDDASYAAIPPFLAAHPLHGAERTIAQQIDRLHVHRAAVAREHDRLAAALRGPA